MVWGRHQLLPLLTLSFMLGIALAANCGATGLTALAWAGIALCLLAIKRLPPDRALVWAALPLFCCAGFVHARFALDRLDGPGGIGGLLAETGRVRVTVAGRILDMVESDGALSRCTLEVFGVLPLSDDAFGLRSGHPRQIQQSSGKVSLRVRGRLPETIQPGARVLALGTAERPKARPGGASRHYAAQGIEALLWLKSPEALKPLPPTGPLSFGERLRFGPERLRGRIDRFLQTRLPPDVAGVYRALLVGSRQGLDPEVQEWFKACGCMHILAISGLHVGLLAAMAAALFYRLLAHSTRVLLSGHARMYALALTSPLLVFYAALAGMNAPVLRALVMALLGLAALMLYRRRTRLHPVAGAALLLLAVRPLALCTASFQLSFAAATAIVLILPRLPWFALTEERGDRRARLRAAALSMLLVAVAATIGTLPFMLWHFNRVSLIGPLMNLLVEPLLCLWALPLGLIALACLPWAPPLAALLLHMGGGGIELALLLLEAGARLPFASVWTITPHPFEIFVYFSIVALVLHGGLRALTAAGLLTCALAVAFMAPFPHRNNVLRVSYIDVGQGASALVELPDGGRFLIDCGGFFQKDYEVGSRIVAPFLWRKRIRRLDAVLASHADSDHYSGIPFILARFGPKRLYVNAGDKDETAYRAMLARAEAAGIAVVRVASREVMAAGESLELACFGAGPEAELRDLGENDRSLLARLAYGKRVFLFPGDLAEPRERLLLQQVLPKKLRADVLMAGHHGSIGSTSPPFLDAVAPKAIVISAAASRKGTHPAPEHLTRWRERGIAVFSTAESGSIEARTDGESLCLRAGGQERCWE